MSPITFHPPLGSHHHLTLPSHLLSSTTSNKTVDLSFVATNLDGLNETDQVEVWTDAPLIDGQGGAERVWRAVKFQKVDVGSERKNEAEEAQSKVKYQGPILSLVKSSNPTDHSQNENTPPQPFISAHIPLHLSSLTAYSSPSISSSSQSESGATRSLTFGYTYRITYPDGNVWWLGDEGGNGQVVVEIGNSGEGNADGEGRKGIWEWDGVESLGVEGIENKGWEGFVIVKDENEGSSTSLTIAPLRQISSSSSEIVVAYLHPPAIPSSGAPTTLLSILPTPSSSLAIVPYPSSILSINESIQPVLKSSAEGQIPKGLIASGDGLKELLSRMRNMTTPPPALTLLETFCEESSSTRQYCQAFKTISNEVLLYSPKLMDSSRNGSLVHRVGIRFPRSLFGPISHGTDQGQSGNLALWSQTLKKAVMLSNDRDDDGDEESDVTVQVEMDQDQEVANMRLVDMIAFGGDEMGEGEGKGKRENGWNGSGTEGVKMELIPAKERKVEYEENEDADRKASTAVGGIAQSVLGVTTTSSGGIEEEAGDDERENPRMATSPGETDGTIGTRVTPGPPVCTIDPDVSTDGIERQSDTGREAVNDSEEQQASISGSDLSDSDNSNDRALIPSLDSRRSSSGSSVLRAIWIALSWFHSLWSGLSNWWKRIKGKDEGDIAADDDEEEEEDEEDLTDLEVQAMEEEQRSLLPQQGSAPETARLDQTERGTADERTPLLSGTSTLVNSPQTQAKSKFTSNAFAIKSEEPQKVKAKKFSPASRIERIPAHIRVTSSYAGDIVLLTTVPKDLLNIAPLTDQESTLNLSFDEASGDLTIVTVKALGENKEFKVSVRQR